MQKLRDAVRQLYEARQRQTKAKAAEKQALKEIRDRDMLIAQLRAELED